MTVLHFLYPLILGCFHPLALVSGTALNIQMCMFVMTPVFSFLFGMGLEFVFGELDIIYVFNLLKNH